MNPYSWWRRLCLYGLILIFHRALPTQSFPSSLFSLATMEQSNTGQKDSSTGPCGKTRLSQCLHTLYEGNLQRCHVSRTITSWGAAKEYFIYFMMKPTFLTSLRRSEGAKSTRTDEISWENSFRNWRVSCRLGGCCTQSLAPTQLTKRTVTQPGKCMQYLRSQYFPSQWTSETCSLEVQQPASWQQCCLWGCCSSADAQVSCWSACA